MSKSIQLDLKQFKHIKSDKNSTTLQHKGGHMLTLAHNSLSPEAKAQLSALSKISGETATSGQKQEADAKYADGGEVADNGDDDLKYGGTLQEETEKADRAGKNSAAPKPPEWVPRKTRPPAPPEASAPIQGPKIEHKAPAPQQSKPTPKEDQGYKTYPHQYADGGDVQQDAQPTDQWAQDAAKISPEMLQKTGDMAMGTVGGVQDVAERSLSSLPDMIAAQQEHIADLTKQLGDYHPMVQKANKVLNSLKDFGNNFKSTKKFADGGVAEDDQVRSENPAYVAPSPQPQQSEQVAAPQAASPYVGVYNQFYKQIKETNPGLPEDMLRRDALGAATNQKNHDEFWSTLSKNREANSQQDNRDRIVEENQQRAALGLPESPVPGGDPASPANAPLPANTQGQQTAQQSSDHKPASDMSGSGDMESMMRSGFNNQMQATKGMGQAQGQLANQEADVLNNQVQAQQEAQNIFRQNYQGLNQERLHMIDDVQKGFIDPNSYWKDHSKIASGIGMILAGIDSGLNGGPNKAVEFLKYNMDRNIEAQKTNLQAKDNLLAHNLRQFGNMRDATEMTRLMQADMVANQLKAAAAKAQGGPNGMAAMNAQNAIGKLQADYAPQFMQFAMRRAMMNLADNGGNPESIDHMLGYMRVVNPEMAKEMQSRYVPGVGLGQTPVPEAVRSEIVSHKKLDDAAKDLLSFTQNHTTINPMSSDYKIGAQKALVVQQMIREGMLGTVFRESEKPLLNKMLDENPAGVMKMISTEPKLRTILEANQAQLNALKQSYGLPVQQAAQSNQSQQALQWAKSNPKDPRAAQILKQLGQ